MHILRGATALSDFRLNKLTHKLQVLDCALQRIHSEFVHFVDVAAGVELDAAKMEVLGQLLSYGARGEQTESRGVLFLVVPRDGTISPWSSKATDIAHNCGLQQVLRVERGIAYYLEIAGELSTLQRQQVEMAPGAQGGLSPPVAKAPACRPSQRPRRP
jgi:phosphoribosylformylglycinamidine synthase